MRITEFAKSEFATPKLAIEAARRLRDDTKRPSVVWFVPRRSLGDVGLGRLIVLTAYDEGPSGGTVVYWCSIDPKKSERPLEQWAREMPALE
jgi:hypothetical protein